MLSSEYTDYKAHKKEQSDYDDSANHPYHSLL